MKVKNGFILRKVGKQYVVAATGEASRNFTGMIRLNEEAAFAIISGALNRTENFYVQAHQGFNSDKAALCKAVETLNHLEAYCATGAFKSQLPYYL